MIPQRYLRATKPHMLSDGTLVRRNDLHMFPTPPGMTELYAGDIEAALRSGLYVEVPDTATRLPDEDDSTQA